MVCRVLYAIPPVGSIDIIGPLLDDKGRAEPAWIAWIAHVAMLSFTLRHSFCRTTDGPILDFLVNDYLLKFSNVPQYEGYEKPKHHCLKHLRKYLELFGPLRGFWCLPFEAFLQILKRMFKLGNYISAPHYVGIFWAAKHALNLKDRARSSWFEDSVEASTEYVYGANLAMLQTQSPLVQACVERQGASGARHVSFISRALLSMEIGDWVIVVQSGNFAVCRIVEMAQVLVAGESLLRIWGAEARPIPQLIEEEGSIRVLKSRKASMMLACLESVDILSVHCTESVEAYEFRFIW